MSELKDKKPQPTLRPVSLTDIRNEVQQMRDDLEDEWTKAIWKRSYRQGRLDALEDVLNIFNRQT